MSGIQGCKAFAQRVPREAGKVSYLWLFHDVDSVVFDCLGGPIQLLCDLTATFRLGYHHEYFSLAHEKAAVEDAKKF
jgi:hypothetical protein